MRMKAFSSQSGYTLLEVIAAVTIINCVFFLALSVTNQSINSYLKVREDITVSQNAHRTLWYIENEIHMSEDIITPQPNTHSNSLKLKQGEYIWDQLSIYHKLDVEELWREKNKGYNPISSNVKSVNFYRTADGKTVIITLIFGTDSSTEKSYEGVVTLRHEKVVK